MKKVISLCAVALLMAGSTQAMNFEIFKKDCAAIAANAYQNFLEDDSLSVDECNELAIAVWDACDGL
ncbi:MAG: hypothetical protein ACPG45_03635 [Flavobacteriaceae bacterium]